MKRSKYSESQIVGILKEADAGVMVKEICRNLIIQTDIVKKLRRKTLLTLHGNYLLTRPA